MLSRNNLLALLALATASVNAHTAFTGIYVNGKGVGDGVAIRMSNDPPTATFPMHYNDEAIPCNIGGDKGRPVVVPVKDGDTLSFEFRTHPNDGNSADGPIERQHWGPCAIYAKKVDDATTAPGTGDGWFKLMEDGYNEKTGQWCNDLLIDNGGVLSLALPKGLQGGDYLFRPELIALHNAHANDAQFYTGCAQVHIESNGGLVPESTLSIPGHMKGDEPALTMNIWDKPMPPFQMPGPKLTKLVEGTSKSTKSKPLFDKECILINANFCAVEVPEFSNEATCWDSSKNCWDQTKTCWDTSPPTGGEKCRLMEAHCEQLASACKSGDYSSFERGKNMTPDPVVKELKFWGNSISGGEQGQNDDKAPSEPSAPSSTPDKPQAPPSSTLATSTKPEPTEPPKETPAPSPDNGGGKSVHIVTVIETVTVKVHHTAPAAY